MWQISVSDESSKILMEVVGNEKTSIEHANYTFLRKAGDCIQNKYNTGLTG